MIHVVLITYIWNVVAIKHWKRSTFIQILLIPFLKISLIYINNYLYTNSNQELNTSLFSIPGNDVEDTIHPVRDIKNLISIFIKILKTYIRKPALPLQQIIRRYNEECSNYIVADGSSMELNSKKVYRLNVSFNRKYNLWSSIGEFED